jgi:hypothetical protein
MVRSRALVLPCEPKVVKRLRLLLVEEGERQIVMASQFVCVAAACNLGSKPNARGGGALEKATQK